MNPIATLRRHGLRETVRLYRSELLYRYACLRTRKVEEYRAPTGAEHSLIESRLAAMGEAPQALTVDKGCYLSFTRQFPFPPDYHGGMVSGVWHEKLFEHYLSFTLLGVDRYGAQEIYLDVAAGGSPWARILRGTGGTQAFAIDLSIADSLASLGYYRQEDATKTSFASGSVRGISLQCAYEMFVGDSDVRAVSEFARILKPGGKVIVAPLYLHTHFCCYSTPEHWGTGLADPGAREYIRRGLRGIPSSRKYDPATLVERILKTARRVGLEPCVYSLRGQKEISPEIYCHFVLELKKPEADPATTQPRTATYSSNAERQHETVSEVEAVRISCTSLKVVCG